MKEINFAQIAINSIQHNSTLHDKQKKPNEEEEFSRKK
jgi:hypothetical protein